MLSEIETSCSAMAFGNDAFDGTRTVLADARGAFRLHGTGSHPASDSLKATKSINQYGLFTLLRSACLSPRLASPEETG